MTTTPTLTTTTLGVDDLLAGIDAATPPAGILDEGAKREIRRATLTAVCVPGYQVPFGSREMPVARGWGSGGLQVTLAVIGADDTVKVIDQGDDAGVNATNLRRLIADSTGCEQSADSREATIVQTRHRVPEQPLEDGQVLVLQVPVPEPLRGVQRSVAECARMHAEADYSTMWVSLYEDIVRNGVITKSTGYPVLVDGRYVTATTPIPRWDVPRLHRSAHLSLFGAGREKRIYAIPPDTDVEPLTFDDVPFEVEEAQVDGHPLPLCAVRFGRHVPRRRRARPVRLQRHRVVRAGRRRRRRPGRAPRGRSPAPAPRPGAARRAPSPRGFRSPRPASCPPPTSGRCWPTASARSTAPAARRAVPGTGPEHGTAVSPETGAIVAAWDVGFDVAPGEAVGLIGESGSGKSTVLRCIVGDEKATAGSLYLSAVDGGRTDVLTLDGPGPAAPADRDARHRPPGPGGRARAGRLGGRQHRRAAHRGGLAQLRGHPRPRRRTAGAGRGAALADGRPGAHVLRRHAPAGPDREGARHRPGRAAARRAHHRARRVRRRRCARPAAQAARRAGRRRRGRQPRLRGDRGAHRPLARDAARPRGRAGLTDQLFHDPHHPYTQRLVAAARR